MQSVAKTLRKPRHTATKIALLMSVVAISAAWTGRDMIPPVAEEATVEVVIRDNQIQAPDSVEAGAVNFRVKNMGQEAVGFAVQDGQGQATVHIEQVAPEGSKTGQAELKPGAYRLLSLDAQGQPTNARNLRVYQPAGVR